MRWLFLMLSLCLALPAAAVEPDEILEDPVLENRARDLSEGLRCLVCRNENIDESNADLARDLRVAVRERLVAGDTDAQVIDYLVDRYGEYVLLRPRTDGANLILWLAGPAMLFLGVTVAVVALRRRRGASARDGELSSEEQARLQALLKE